MSRQYISNHSALVILARAVAHIVERTHARDRLSLGVRCRGASALLIRCRHKTQPVLVIAAEAAEEVKLTVGGNVAIECETGAVVFEVILAAFIVVLGARAQLGAISSEVFSRNVDCSIGAGTVTSSRGVEGDTLERVFLPSGGLEVDFGIVAFRVCFHAFLD